MATRRSRPAGRYQATSFLALVLTAALAISIPASFANVWGDSQAAALYERLRADYRGEPGSEPVPDEEVAEHDALVVQIALLSLAIFVGGGVVWLIWFKRLYANLPALGTKRRKHKVGWAVGGWFVPILNLVRPYQIAQEIWTESAPRPEPPAPPPTPMPGEQLGERDLNRSPNTRAKAGPSVLLQAWWFAWIGTSIFSLAASKAESAAISSMERVTDDASYESAMASLQSANSVMTWADALDIPMAILAILVVRALDQRQSALADDVADRALPEME